MPISHIPILICQTHSHTDLKGIPTRPLLTALWQRLRHVLDLIFSTFHSPLPSTATPHLDTSTPLTRCFFFNRRFPPLKRKEENTGEQNAPNSEAVFKLAEKSANPRQADTEARLRVRRRARRAGNSEFKPQRLPGGQSRRRLENPTNHSTGGGTSGRGAWPRICALSLASLL